MKFVHTECVKNFAASGRENVKKQFFIYINKDCTSQCIDSDA